MKTFCVAHVTIEVVAPHIIGVKLERLGFEEIACSFHQVPEAKLPVLCGGEYAEFELRLFAGRESQRQDVFQLAAAIREPTQ